MQTVFLPVYTSIPPSRGKAASGVQGERAAAEPSPSGAADSASAARDLLGMSSAAEEQPVVAVQAAGSSGPSPLVDLSSHVPAWKRVAHYVLHSAHLLLEGAEMAHVMSGAAVGGALGNAFVGIGMAALGVSHVVEGVRNKSGEMVLEGVGAVLTGAKSGLEAVALGGEHGHAGLAAFAHSAHGYLAPLGVAHGGIEAALGAYGMYKGAKAGDLKQVGSSALSVGLGASVCAAALGGGVPAVMAAGVFLAGRIVVEESQNFKAQMSGTALPPGAKGWRFTA